MEYFQTRVDYQLTASGSKCFGLSSLYASVYGINSILTRTVNWNQASIADAALLLVNIYMFTCPSLLLNMHGGLGSAMPLVPRIVVRAISQFLPLHRENESYYFQSDLTSLDKVHEFIDSLTDQVKECLRSEEYQGQYALPQFADSGIWKKQMTFVLAVLTRYRACTSATQLAGEIAVSFSRLPQLPGFPEADSVLSKLSDFVGVKSNTAPYGVRRHIPLGNKVAFWGEPSVVTLSLSRLFVSEIKAVFEASEPMLINVPPMGYNVVVVDDRSQGSWLISLLQGAMATNTVGKLEVPDDASPVVMSGSRNQTTPRATPSILRLTDPRVERSGSVVSGKRKFSSSALSPGSRGDTLYLFDGQKFTYVGLVSNQ